MELFTSGSLSVLQYMLALVKFAPLWTTTLSVSSLFPRSQKASTKTFCIPLLVTARFHTLLLNLGLFLLALCYDRYSDWVPQLSKSDHPFIQHILWVSLWSRSPPPPLAPQPMRLLRRSSISISQGLKKFQGLQNLSARLRHQDTLFLRLF